MSTQILDPYQVFAIPIPRDGLVVEYKGKNNTLDTSENEFDGIGTDITYGPGIHEEVDSAFVLNGSSSSIDIDASLAGLATTTVNTWSVWVKPTLEISSGTEDIISFGDTNANSFFRLFKQTTGEIQATIRHLGVSKWAVTTDNSVTADDEWVHIAFVTSNNKLYINGIAVAQTITNFVDLTWWLNNNPDIDNGNISLLKFNSITAANFDGSIALARIWNRALSQAEITALANE